MKVLLVPGKTRHLSVVLHKGVQALPADREVSAAREEQRGVILAGIDEGFQYPRLVRLHRVLPAVTPLQSVAIDSELLIVNVGLVKPSDFRSPKAVPVGDNEDGAVAFVALDLDRIE